MNILTLVGVILDSIWYYGNEPYKLDDETIVVDFGDINTMDALDLYELCHTKKGWNICRVVIGENPHCHRGEIKSIIFKDSFDKVITCNVANKIRKELSAARVDEVYYEMCDRILMF